MTKKQREALEACSANCIGKGVTFRIKGDNRQCYLVGTIEDVVSVVGGEYNHMIQQIRLCPEKAVEWGCKFAYRTGYYTLTNKTKRPAWGQYHDLVTQPVYRELARKAHAKRWLGLPPA